MQEGMQDRPYQRAAIDAIQRDWEQGKRDTLLVCATGGGKTNVFLRILSTVLQDITQRGLIIAHRKELINQPYDRLQSIDPTLVPRTGLLTQARKQYDQQLTIATIQTLMWRQREQKGTQEADPTDTPPRYPTLDALLAHGAIDYLIIDECHHATASTYKALWQRLREVNPDLRHLGVTATPIRADDAVLGEVYQHCSAKVTMAELIKLKYLIPPRWLGIYTDISLVGVHKHGEDFSPAELAQRFDTADGRATMVSAYQQYGQGRKTIAYTAGVEGAYQLAQAFCDAGIPAVTIEGQTPPDARASYLTDFHSGTLNMIVNCMVLTEGVDIPSVGCILNGCPTGSDSLYIQKMGRGMRPRNGWQAEEGEDCLIIDMVPAGERNTVMAGDVLGLPREVIAAVKKEKRDPAVGEALTGFTYDGEHFDADGSPMEIISRQLDYLNTSPFVWYRRDNWLTLGLGKAHDGNERILVIVPDGEHFALYGLLRPPSDGRPAPYRMRRLAEGTLEEMGERGNQSAAEYAAQIIVKKKQQWMRESASDAQQQYLKRLSRGELSRTALLKLKKGEAAQLITYYQAREVLQCP